MSLGRRDFILGTLSAAAAAGPLAQGCADGDEPGTAAIADLPLDSRAFAHGVASGDPLPDAVILWTRLSGVTAEAIVRYQVARDPALREVVASGTATTDADRDYTVHVDVTGLAAGTTYYYAFAGEGGRSVTGRTRTLPSASTHARIAFTSCANYQNGYFNAYRAIARRADLDLWIHLGDYIYEYAPGQYPELNPTRAHEPPHETVRLADYRTRYAQYRLDPDLQEIHRQHPLIAVWDDHEFANNANVAGAQNHMPETEGDWTQRKREAARAFQEWLPIRAGAADPVPKIFRSFAFGELFDLVMLDTRMIARAPQAGSDELPLGANVGDPAVWRDPTRQLIGSEQEAWFLDELQRSRSRGAAWRLIGNQVIFAHTRNPLGDPSMPSIVFSDFWDGYQPARQRVIDGILSSGITDLVFLTGDIHASFALEISRDPFAVPPPPSFAVELVGPAVTSQAFEGTTYEEVAEPALLSANRHARFANVTRKGYVLVDLTPERLQAEWYYVIDHRTPGRPEDELGKAFTCERGAARLVEVASATTPRADAPAPAPTA